MMTRDDKAAMVQFLNKELLASSVVLVAHYKGLTVADMSTLRGNVRKSGASFKVAKNLLAKRALIGTAFEGMTGLMVGPTAIAYSSDPVAIAKVLVEFAKQNDKLVVIGGAFGANMLDAQAVAALSKLPSLDELRAKIIGLIQAPAQKLAAILVAPAGATARVIGAHARKGEAA